MTNGSAGKVDPLQRAEKVETQFRIYDEVYLIGSLEKGVTVYGQQVRTHNLSWALWKLDAAHGKAIGEVAIVGGGITGLTTAACTLGLFPNANVTVFEQRWDLCALQQGCDSRWLHPRIYGWPGPGSRAPSASLPILNWEAGRASDVADHILREFSEYCKKYDTTGRLRVYLGVDHIKVSVEKREIQWVGRAGVRDNHFFRAGNAEGQSKKFDRILLAVGFGMETQLLEHPTESYWRNEDSAQPALDGKKRTYILSGYGDGALVDLCRLTIERFRQDRILDDLFGGDIGKTEAQLRPIYEQARKGENIFSALTSAEHALFGNALTRLRSRIRKDTHVILQLAGRPPTLNTTLSEMFFNTSSFMNRLLLFLLYRCGAFIPSFAPLDSIVREHASHSPNVICRYGPDALSHVTKLFDDPSRMEWMLKKLKSAQSQDVRLDWEPNCFPR